LLTNSKSFQAEL